MKYKSGILKLALFATGLSGIVAEYVLSTMATYFLGDSVFQWTMIVSIMLFSMGLGSRLSQLIQSNLLLNFIKIEFILSLLTAFASVIAYSVYAQFEANGVIIYCMSILIGTLIGMEIPLVIRLNEEFEELRVNVSSVMEKDYYGSLVGGMFFAFIGLPYLGLTYTPFLLGTINFLVALSLLLVLYSSIEKEKRRTYLSMTAFVIVILMGGVFTAETIVQYGEQSRYRDPVVFEKQSKYQKIVMTHSGENFWLFINGNQQLSSVDEVMYHEPLVHPAMALSQQPTDVLVLGGGDGGAIREIIKYPSVKKVVLVDLDPAMTEVGRTHPLLVTMNEGALENDKVEIINRDGFKYLEEEQEYFDVIIVDLPDPKTVELGRLYSSEFYLLANRRLKKNGIIVTQAGSPYYAAKAYRCIRKSIASAGFSTLALHNQVTTLGEWGWIVGAKNTSDELLKETALKLSWKSIDTKWVNNESMKLMTSFGKKVFPGENDDVEINTIHNPVLYRYYLKGIWDLY